MDSLQQVKARIDANLDTHYTIANLAAYTGMGETKLKRSFRQYYGKGLFAYLQQQRMELAAALLQSDSNTIKMVARKCGYRNFPNFSAAFTVYYGIRPGEYRRQARQKLVDNCIQK